MTERPSKKCVSCIVNHSPCNVAQNQVGITLGFFWCIVSNNLQDVSLLVSIFFSRSPLSYTPVDPASLPSSPPNALVLADAVFLLIGQAPASVAGFPAAAALFKVSVPVSLFCQS